MKDITSTSFGLVIAFLLPGLALLYSFTFWSATMKKVFETFLTAESNVGLFLLVLLAGVAVGLHVTVVRWLIFEKIVCRDVQLEPENFASLGKDEAKLAAFRAAVDEHYRYHQFWGGMFVALPFLFFGWIRSIDTTLGMVIWAGLLFASVWMLIAFAAAEAFRNYVGRARPIMGGLDHAERVGGKR